MKHPDASQIERLPKWAQLYIDNLRREAAEWETRFHGVAMPVDDESEIIVGGHSAIMLNSGAHAVPEQTIAFKVLQPSKLADRAAWLEVDIERSWTKRLGLAIRSPIGAIGVTPHSGNVVHVWPDPRG